MHGLLLCLADVQHAAGIIYLRDTVVALMEAVLETSQFVNEYLGKTGIGLFKSKH